MKKNEERKKERKKKVGEEKGRKAKSVSRDIIDNIAVTTYSAPGGGSLCKLCICLIAMLYT